MYSTLFHIFGIPIRAYGLMMVIGFAVGLWRAVRVARHRGISPDRVYDLSLIVLVAGIVGARLLYIAIDPETPLADFFAVWDGGLSFHGGIALAAAAGFVYTRRTRLPFWQVADLIAPSAAIGYAFTRIGCFLNGCCQGVPTSLPWGARFIEHGSLTPPSHPTQLYGTIASLVIFAILVRLEKLKRAPGFVFVAYLGMYGVYRLLVEFVRVGDKWLLGLAQAQWVSIVMALASAVAVFAIYRRPVSKK